eukprot:TRINITY_DN2097_c0_g1_i4.p1 TRINITY_DN2097_c0_g1~~TRINITY_DN2097_c0_g1_i4.p1  ORF type:complete len:456 (-),score=54.68 TRINITY_DN2097_c0_g1_i4:1-1323(-)
MSAFSHSQTISPHTPHNDLQRYGNPSESSPNIALTRPTSLPPTSPSNVTPTGPMSFPSTAHQNMAPTGPIAPHMAHTEPMSFPQTAHRNIALSRPTSFPITGYSTYPHPLYNTIPSYVPLPHQTNQSYTITNPQGQTFLVKPIPSELTTLQEFAAETEIGERPKNPSKWMSETHLPLKDLPILGTNNSGFFMGQHRAQRVDISEQLKLGVRLLDLAIVQYQDEIYLDQYKHIYDLCCPYITISEALLSIRFFLEKNPNEVLYLHLRCMSEAANKDQDASDPIDCELLEAKFDVIKKFFLDVQDINLEYNAKKLTALKKNIICFANDEPCFHFLRKNGISLHANQLDMTSIINDHNISPLLKQHWTKQKVDASVANPYEKRFSWFVIDAVTADRDAAVLKERWTESNKAGKPVPFHFVSLCKVTQKTWTDFRDLILSKHPQ